MREEISLSSLGTFRLISLYARALPVSCLKLSLSVLFERNDLRSRIRGKMSFHDDPNGIIIFSEVIFQLRDLGMYYKCQCTRDINCAIFCVHIREKNSPRINTIIYHGS